MALETDQRLRLAADNGEALAAALHLGDRQQRFRFEFEVVGNGGDFASGFVGEHACVSFPFGFNPRDFRAAPADVNKFRGIALAR
jgi:hypothetical protein